MIDPHLSSLTPVRSHIVGVRHPTGRAKRHRRPAASAVRALIATAAAAGIALRATQATGPSHLLLSPTVQAAALVAAICGIGAVCAATGGPDLPAGLTGAAVLYLTSAALLHHFVLGDRTGARTAGQSVAAVLLHTAVPLAVTADWLLLTAAARYGLRHSFRWLVCPLAYLALVLTRGALVARGTPDRYPYRFLDADADGYHHVLLNAMELGVALWLLSSALIGLDHLRPSLRNGHNAISSPAAGPLK
jgi:hypothetical protein